MNASTPPSCLRVSFVAPSISPLYASSLALLRLMFLPNITPNSNSFVTEVSKSSNPSDIPLSVAILTPNFAAYPAALRMFEPPSLPNNANSSAEFAKSPINWAGMIPFCFANSWEVFDISNATSVEFPFNIENALTNLVASPPLIPMLVDIKPTLACNSNVALFVSPSAALKSLAFCTASPNTNDNTPAFLATPSVWRNEVPNSELASPIFPTTWPNPVMSPPIKPCVLPYKVLTVIIVPWMVFFIPSSTSCWDCIKSFCSEDILA